MGVIQEVQPERIGPYRVLQLLGEGGMGAVYEAEESGPVRRRVAVKVVHAGQYSRDVTARFEAERQALALMNHPGIAKVFNAGTTDTGEPYFTMELVRGSPSASIVIRAACRSTTASCCSSTCAAPCSTRIRKAWFTVT